MSVFTRINPDEFPQMKPHKATIGPFPGGVLVERRMAQFQRYATALGLLSAPFRFWHKQRRTLSPVLKEQVLLQNFARDGVAWGGAGGFAAGTIVGIVEGCLRFPTTESLVNAAVELRKDKDHDRWTKTWARSLIFGVTYGVLFIDHPSLVYRLGCGSGAASLLAVALSYSYFDLAISMLH